LWDVSDFYKPSPVDINRPQSKLRNSYSLQFSPLSGLLSGSLLPRSPLPVSCQVQKPGQMVSAFLVLLLVLLFGVFVCNGRPLLQDPEDGELGLVVGVVEADEWR